MTDSEQEDLDSDASKRFSAAPESDSTKPNSADDLGSASSLEETCSFGESDASSATPSDLEATAKQGDEPGIDDMEFSIHEANSDEERTEIHSFHDSALDVEATQNVGSSNIGVSEQTDDLAMSIDASLVAGSISDATFFGAAGRAVASEPPMDLLAGDRIEGFEILEELGRGAFGVVYLARDEKLDRKVAIKVPLLGERKLASQYIQEARNAAKIDAPGIVPVLQVGTTAGGQPFVAQKFIDGSTLGEILQTANSVPVSWAISTLIKIARSINVAHESGLVHRDLKPDNILIDRKGEPWIVDFGLAVFEEDQSSLAGEIAGTPAYMAPEQLSGHANWLDGRADVWALGVILYKMLSGRLPFDATGFQELTKEVLNRHPKPLSQRSAELPKALDAVFNLCCAKDLTDRYASARELVADLQQVLQTCDLPREEIQIDTTQDGQATIRSVVKTINTNSSFAGNVPGGSKRVLISAVTAIGVILLACCAYSLWPRGDSGSGSVGASSGGSPTAGAKIVVSQQGNGTHGSIAEAIAAAEVDSEIYIQPGTYRESVEVDKNIALIGQGARDEIKFIGKGASALVVDGGQRVTLTNLSIDASGDKINTIELKTGSLELKGCSVNTDSYDCVKLHSESALIATGTDFVSARHPALVAEPKSRLNLEKCHFRFNLLNSAVEREEPAVAIQLTDSSGTIRECTFTGNAKKGKGISSRDASKELLIQRCDFTGLLHGVEFFGCSEVKLGGVNVFSDCQVGVYCEQSSGEFEDLEMVECAIGMGVLRQSDLVVYNAQFKKCSIYGLNLQDSHLSMEQCIFEDNSKGLLIDCRGPGKSVEARDCTMSSNDFGCLLLAGHLDCFSGLISQNTSAGIAVLSYAQVPFVKGRATEPDPVRRITTNETRINAKGDAAAVLFNAPGSYRIKGGSYVDFRNSNKPGLAPSLTLKILDSDTKVIPR
ncbi:MAG: protein kinase [Planctomycetota bacterium]|nr:protein kinase [Planctomycetota bacterium]